MDPKVIRLFMNYPWPGNVRELERILEYAYVFVKGPVIFQRNLPELDLLMKERLPENQRLESQGGSEPANRTCCKKPWNGPGVGAGRQPMI